jgi:signal transduction histidine kinase/CheY-like chemotaxis protein/HPt (histidine-containing phosphotransfer) domain-containing protein
MTFRMKQSLIGVLIAAIAVSGWLIAYQTTQRLAQGVENVARLQQIVDSLEAAAGGDLTDIDRQMIRQVPARIAAARAEVSAQNGALVAEGLLSILVLLALALMFNRNLSRQQRDQEKLTAAMQAADAANSAKSRFLATVSHEIRTPLNALSGMNQLLLDTRLDSEQMEYARTVHSNAEALSLLIGDLLDSSKIEAGQMDLESLPFDVWELAESVAEILVVRADIKGVELILDIAPEVPRSLVGDGNRLRQVLMNLVANAVKFTEQGEVILRVRSESSGDRSSAMLHFSIIDTGIGIPPEAQERIFEPFVQADRSTVRRYGGTGLGLNISRSLIQLMGGTLSLESMPGKGSTFDARVTLPLDATQPAPAFTPQSLAGIDVLLVDSNASTRDTLGRMLTAAGATIRVASTAGEARDVFAAWPAVRVIVIDDSLPDGSALDLIRDTWQTRQDNMPPLGIVPTCSLRSVMARYVGIYGISSCVYKPAKTARLIEALRHAAGLEAEGPNRHEVERPVQTRGGPVRPRILLAEDHHDSLVLATRILATAGYDVDLAEDGVKGVELAAAFSYDLILMDVEMPRLDGIEATQQIRARERELNQPPVPVVALTAHALEDIRHQTRSAGMDGFVTKPLQRKQLLDTCSQWIDRRPLILVADDAHENHVLISNLLGTSDYRLVFAFDGREAVTAFERQPISLVVLDIDMPIMNGYDAARTIRRARGGDVVPIVALTGYEGSDERQRCIDAGCTAYLSKALNRASLLSTIDELLGRPPVRGSRSNAPRLPQATPAPAGPPTAAATLPSEREATDHVRGLLARHDFDAVATYAKHLVGTAEQLVLSKLATVSEELEDAARRQDQHRVEWWSDQLGPALVEATRLVDLRRHAQSLAGDSYDTLSRLALTLLGAYCASVTLVDEDGVRIKGSAGLSASFDDARSLPFSRSISQHVVTQGTLVVEDARSDPRMRRALTVHDGIISFAAIPITNTEGTTLGAFCAMDRRPHRWHAEDVAMLEELASVASWMMNMERSITTVPGGEPKPQDTTAPPPEPVSTVVTIQDDIVDLVPDYVASRRRDVETLHSHLSRGEFDAAGRLGHKMKGSGAGYGLSELTRIGRELEVAAKLQNAESLRKSIADLSAYLSQLTVRTSDGRVLVQP